MTPRDTSLIPPLNNICDIGSHDFIIVFAGEILSKIRTPEHMIIPPVNYRIDGRYYKVMQIATGMTITKHNQKSESLILGD